MGLEYASIRELGRAWGKVPLELRQELRPRIRAGADSIVRDMKSRAGYSSRIPSAIRTTVSFASTTGGVSIRVDARRAPHARPLEGTNARGGYFRHPVFGDRTTWVSQPTQPFFFPAIKAGGDQLRRHISEAVRASLRGVSGT